MSLYGGIMQKITDYLSKYTSLFIILIFCFALSCVMMIAMHNANGGTLMQYFMAYFFIFLSLFKFLDINGFVKAFAAYDLLAQKFRFYGYCYPFVEFSIGISYLCAFLPLFMNIVTFTVMTISGIGVVKSLLSGQKIKCACLGSALNIPLGVISAIENFGMGFLAAYNIIFL